jgi:hypothetical protein
MSAREVHPFDHGVRRNDQPLIPSVFQDRRVVSGAYEDRRGETRQTRQQARQKGMFTEFADCH